MTRPRRSRAARRLDPPPWEIVAEADDVIGHALANPLPAEAEPFDAREADPSESSPMPLTESYYHDEQETRDAIDTNLRMRRSDRRVRWKFSPLTWSLDNRRGE